MELYSQKDVDLVDSQVDNIADTIEKLKIDTLEPNRKEIMAVNKIVMQFVRDKKLKIYGGYAQNKLIETKNKSDAFYSEDEIPDIDCYSTEPIKDAIALADLLYKAGFKHVVTKEGQHAETYKVFVNFAPEACDLSYVPKNIYHKIPFVEIDGLRYVHPSFIYIDLYKMFTEPYFSSRRWKKTFPRLYRLQKHYPFNKASSRLNSAYNVPKQDEDIIAKIENTIIAEFKKKDSVIVVGQYAYNYLLAQSEILKDKQLGKNYQLIKHPFLQVISTNYVKDATEIGNKLQKEFKNISFREFYPFWTFTGYSTIVYYNKTPVLHITSHLKKCTPYQKINGLLVGSFDIIFLYSLISKFRAKVNDLEDKYHYHNIMLSHLIEMRNYYLKKQKMTLLDESPFKSLGITCTGDTIDPRREAIVTHDRKYKEGKLVVFKYNPEQSKEAPDYKFANTSGNEINKDRNLRVIPYIKNPALLKKTDTEVDADTDEEDITEETRDLNRQRFQKEIVLSDLEDV